MIYSQFSVTHTSTGEVHNRNHVYSTLECTYTFKKIMLYFYFWLCRVFCACGRQGLLSSCGAQALGAPALSCCRWTRQQQLPGSIAVAHGLSCSAACGIFPDQGSNSCLLHWQANSLPLSHQGSPSQFSQTSKQLTILPMGNSNVIISQQLYLYFFNLCFGKNFLISTFQNCLKRISWATCFKYTEYYVSALGNFNLGLG